jgi:hypothetical protein
MAMRVRQGPEGSEREEESELDHKGSSDRQPIIEQVRTKAGTEILASYIETDRADEDCVPGMSPRCHNSRTGELYDRILRPNESLCHRQSINKTF